MTADRWRSTRAVVHRGAEWASTVGDTHRVVAAGEPVHLLTTRGGR